jgi:hypothetical protein
MLRPNGSALAGIVEMARGRANNKRASFFINHSSYAATRMRLDLGTFN